MGGPFQPSDANRKAAVAAVVGAIGSPLCGAGPFIVYWVLFGRFVDPLWYSEHPIFGMLMGPFLVISGFFLFVRVATTLFDISGDYNKVVEAEKQAAEAETRRKGLEAATHANSAYARKHREGIE